ncbi:MAG: O-methyltransferase [Flavobacteriaceae bacterium]|jgi:caffeoyl-CoA O-methyltransferase|nr:O-methyltransferase [Flavobacteriaceae bacterium]MBT4113878.1 O-methyltransferase [Flavobacteriaceae bacterium]MBT4613763.1 O-methyltransferase [Flavobacteriaceae bacterium]MBT5246343.1 O-methyltransferase [Flavobacteriaceae bacterium]MBT5650396.1 O-methyltransferase [Flavobacteriaceae bacterium]
MNFIPKEIYDYIKNHSVEESNLLKELSRNTKLKILNPRMLSGSYQGRILSMISKLTKPKYILEVGTYTGYATLCLAEGIRDSGELHTIDNNEELYNFQREYFNKSGYGDKIFQHLGNAIDLIDTINLKFDLIFLDADKENYTNYLELLANKLNTNGVLITDNVLWSGKVIKSISDDDLSTQEIDKFNKLINQRSDMETIILPIRDGISISRKK